MASHSSLRGAINEAIKMQLKLTGDHQPCVKVRNEKSQMKLANREVRPVKDIIEPAKTVASKASVQAALNELQARGVDSSPVTDQRGELLGAVSKNEMNRKVGGMGARPEDRTRTGRSQHGKKQSLLLRRPDSCGGGANYARRKCRRSSCSYPRKIGGGNNKS